jgi:hypothetical protein
MQNRRRNGVALLVMLCGVAIGAGAFLTWIDARGSRPASGIKHTAITGLFHWSYQYSSSFLRSFGMVLVVAGALILIGGLVASRFMAALFAVIALAVAALWVGLNASHYNSTNLPYSDLRIGAWLALGGSLIALISAFFVRRSGSRVRAYS